jgi:hypothetical protein
MGRHKNKNISRILNGCKGGRPRKSITPQLEKPHESEMLQNSSVRTFTTKHQGEYVIKLRQTSAKLQAVYNVSSQNINGVIQEVSEMLDVQLHGPLPTRQQHINFVLEQNAVLLYYLVNQLYDQQVYSYITDITTKKGNSFHINLLQSPNGQIFNIGNFLIHDNLHSSHYQYLNTH